MISFFQTESKDHSLVPLLLTHLGQDYLQEPVERPFGTSHYAVFLVQKGDGELILAGEQMKVREGECFILFPEVAHSYHGIRQEWIVSMAGFTGGICAGLFECLGIRESGIYSLSDPSVFTEHVELLRKLTEQTPIQADWSPACYRFLLELSGALTFQTGREILPQEVPESSYSFRVIQYLESHLTETIALADLADSLGLNSEYLCTVFKRETGLTIIQYLQRLRIGRARLMLERYPERDAAEIGRACGYDSPSYFGLQFKRITGTTPNRYRKSAAAIRY